MPALRNRIGGSLAAAALACAAIPASQAGAAGAAPAGPPAPGWHIAQAIGVKQASNLLSVAAAGPDNAWAFGDGIRGKPLVLHWNGTQWLRGTLPGAHARPDLVSATSRTDVWAGGKFCEGGVQGAPPLSTYVSRWNGTRWTTTFFRHIDWCGQTLVTTSYGSGWLFTNGSLAEHLDGSTWHAVQLGNVGTVITATAVSASDVWGFTYRSSDDKMLAIHWNGTAWHQVALPKLKAGRRQHNYPWASYASASTGVWLSETGVPGTPYTDSRLLHWTGHSWQQVVPPGNARILAITSDGAGGLWCLGPGKFLHYSHGKWQSYPAPIVGLPGNPTRAGAQIYALAAIPGTKSVWATGEADYANRKEVSQEYSVIYKFSE